MPILFAISILALVALLWASISIARHIRRARLTSPASAAMLLPELLEEAVFSQDVSQYLSTNAEVASLLPSDAGRTTSSAQAGDASPAKMELAEVAATHPLPPRKFPPVAATAGRLDWTYFKEEMGDLTDPRPAHSKLRHRAR